MAHKIVISPLAHIDEYEAYEWYELQRTGLGEEFLAELVTAYNKISLHPEYFGFIDDKKILRDYLLPRFPFLIVYRVNNDTIDIIAVHHSKKHPSKKYGKEG
jgi:toxin ParE1/3/4